MTVLPIDSEQQLNELCHRIRAAGLRVTSARRAVLRFLLKSTGPISHREVADELVKLGIDPATVYRNLVSLSSAGLLSRNEFGDHVWRFELRSSEDSSHNHTGAEHPHMICTKCGQVICLSAINIEFIDSVLKSEPAIGVIREVIVKGKCRRCLAATDDH